MTSHDTPGTRARRMLTGRRVRVRDEGGFITLQAMAIVILMLGTLLFVVGAAASSRNAAREGREFTNASRGTDQALARVEHYFNSAPTYASNSTAPFGLSGATSRATATMAAYGTPEVFPGATWSTDAATKTVTVSSVSDDTRQTVTMPVRGKLVSSYKDNTQGTAAGIPAGPAAATGPQDALGAWGSAVSTSAGTSVVKGLVKGQWDQYGGYITDTAGAHTVTYSSSAARPTSFGLDAAGVPGTYERSLATAYLDEKQHNQLMANVVTNNASCNGAAGKGLLLSQPNLINNPSASYFCAKGDVTLPTVNQSARTTPVTTVVVKGNLRLDGYINTAGISATATELHIYVDGNVTFGQMSGTQQFNRIYIFAPNGTCASAAGSTAIVQLWGSIACRTVDLDASATGNSVTWVRPKNQPAAAPYTYSNVSAPLPVYYFEKPGFVDQLTP